MCLTLSKRYMLPSRFTAMMRTVSSLVAVILCFLVCGVSADFPCKPEQIHWNATTGRRYKCLECPDCPAGLQPSVPCGTSVSYGTPIDCVTCQLGKTYSGKYGKAQCEGCTVCSEGKAVKKNCTLFSNTECDNKCTEGYYHAPFVFKCFRCAKCCGDEKDELEQECANYDKKCKIRSVPCPNVPTGTTEAPTYGRLIIVHSQKTSGYSLQTTQEQRPLHVSKVPTSSGSENNHYSSGSREWESRQDSIQNKTLWLAMALAVVLIAILILLVVLITGQFNQLGFRSPCHSANTPVTVPSDREQPTSTSQERLNLVGDITLAQLESSNLEVFDEMCLKLDNGRTWFRRDFERLAAKFAKIPLEVRNSMQDQLKVEGGSPSKMLMTQLQTKYPMLTVREFVKKLQEIGREDIVQLLITHLGQDPQTAQ